MLKFKQQIIQKYSLSVFYLFLFSIIFTLYYYGFKELKKFNTCDVKTSSEKLISANEQNKSFEIDDFDNCPMYNYLNTGKNETNNNDYNNATIYEIKDFEAYHFKNQTIDLLGIKLFSPKKTLTFSSLPLNYHKIIIIEEYYILERNLRI